MVSEAAIKRAIEQSATIGGIDDEPVAKAPRRYIVSSYLRESVLVLGVLLLAGCDSGSSTVATGSGGGTGLVIQGTVTEGDGTSHGGSSDGGSPPSTGSGVISGRDIAASVMHSAGEPIENVDVCVFGQCSRTDSLGQWGMAAPESFTGGEALFTVSGHGIDDTVVIALPAAESDLEISLVHNSGEGVAASRIIADGVDATLSGDSSAEDHQHTDDHEHGS